MIINSLIAAGLSAMILFKDKDSKEEDKTNIFLTLGLVFWFIANIIWAYYEVVLDIVSPVPSLADLFLLSAYGFLIYRLIIIYRNLGHVTNRKILLLIISGTGLFLVYILNLTLELTELSNLRSYALCCHDSISYVKFYSNGSCIDDPPWNKERKTSLYSLSL